MNEFVFEKDQKPLTRIKVIGVGGGGCNAVNSMVDLGLPGVEIYAVNTDSQALSSNVCPNRVQIGREVTMGMGAGGDPALGEKAAVADRDLLASLLEGGDMVFITACMGGGTGTGASPVIAELAKSMGILTVAMVTKPFQFEGPQRKQTAQTGIDRLKDFVDALIIVTNDKLMESVGPKTPLIEAFGLINGILCQCVKSISDLIYMPGLINADFQHVRSVMGETGGAVLGVGAGKGENRATEAVKKACSATLQEKIVIDGARRVLISVTGGADLTLHEVWEAASLVYEAADPEAQIYFSVSVDGKLSDEVRVTIIATGFSEEIAKLSATPLSAAEKRPPLSKPGFGAPTLRARPIPTAGPAPAPAPRFDPVPVRRETARETVREAVREPARETAHAAEAPRMRDSGAAVAERAPDKAHGALEEDFLMAEAEQPVAAAPVLREIESGKPKLSSWLVDENEDDDSNRPFETAAPEVTLGYTEGSARDPYELTDEESETASEFEESLDIPAFIRRRKSFFT